MEHSTNSTYPHQIVMDTQPQFIDIQEVIQPQHVVEIQQSELATASTPPNFSILQPDADFKIIPSDEVTGNSTGEMEYSLEEVTNMNKGVIVEYQDGENIEVYEFDDQSNKHSDMTTQILDGTQLLETQTSDAAVLYDNVTLVQGDDKTAEKSQQLQEETVEGEDICQVRVEVTNQVFLDDMKNIDIFVVYTCKKCGYGDQNVTETINHARSCSRITDTEEMNMKLSKVVNLFKTFSHRSVPLSECIAPVTNQNETSVVLKRAKEKPVEVSVEKIVQKTPPKPKPAKLRAIATETGPSEEDIETLVAKSKETWLKSSDTAKVPAESIEPRKWFCSDCPATVIFSETEFNYHSQCHTKTPAAKKFSCRLCETSEEGRRKVLQCDDWNTMKTHLTAMHKVDMKLGCPDCKETFSTHQKYHKHVRSHKHECRFDSCAFATAEKKSIFAHERCHSLEDTSTFKCFKCDWVSESYPKKWNLMHIHLTRNHPGTIEPLYKCKLCQKEFAEIRRYNNHMVSCKFLPVPLRPTCVICGKPVNDVDLKDHILKHAVSKHWHAKIKEVLGNNPRSENPPQKQTSSIPQQKQIYVPPQEHTSNVLPQNNETLVSSINQLSTKPAIDESKEMHVGITEKQKQKRVLVSSGLLTEKCNFCYKKFQTPERLAKHIKRSHPDNGRNPTVCDTCGSSFRNKEQWRNHNRQVHLGIKRKASSSSKPSSCLYMCETCTYASPSFARLRNHYSTVHMGVHPYQCVQCSYKTNEASDLRRHTLKHLGKKPFACTECDYKTTQHWILVNHAQRLHGITLPKRQHTNSMGCEFSLKRNSMTRKNVVGLQYFQEEGSEVLKDEATSQVQNILGQQVIQHEESVMDANDLSQVGSRRYATRALCRTHTSANEVPPHRHVNS